MKAAFGLGGLVVVAVGAWITLAPDAASNLLIEDAIASPMEDGSIVIFLTVNNQGGPDNLTAVSSSAGSVMLHQAFGTDHLPIQAGQSSLASDAAHIMMTPDAAPLEEGALLPVTLTFANAGDVQLKARMTASALQGHMGMAMMDDVPAMEMDIPTPSLGLDATAAGDGWQVTITVEDFTFSEDKMGMPHEAGTGHAHIYVGGMKLGRVFGPDFKIGQLPAGSHEIRVTLNTNDHRPYMGADGPVTATTVIEVD